MRADDIPGFDPLRLDHQRALAELKACIRDGAPSGVVAGAKAHWQSWVYVTQHPRAAEFAQAWLLGEALKRDPRMPNNAHPAGNRKARRERRRRR